MARLRVKVGRKGQILIPKIFRDRYGFREGSLVTIEPEESGVPIRERPSVQKLERETEKHVKEMKGRGIRGPRLGELQRTCLEMEFQDPSPRPRPRSLPTRGL